MSLLLGGCVSTAYKDQVTALGTATSAIATSLPGQAAVDAEGAAVLDFKTDVIMLGGAITYESDCGDSAFVAYKVFVETLDKPQADQDAPYKALLKAKPCNILPFIKAQVSVAPPTLAGAAVGGPAHTAAKPDAAEEAKLKQEDSRNAREDARKAAGEAIAKVSAQPEVKPECKAVCTLDDYLELIKTYGAEIQAAATAQNASDAQTAAGSADTEVDKVLSSLKASPLATAITDAVAAIGKLAIQQAQYAAMKHTVLAYDYVWSQAAPAAESGARFRQAQLILYRANASQVAGAMAQQYLNNDSIFHSPAERLNLFNILDAKVETAAASLKAGEIDPGAAIAAFVTANHTLALAMDNPSLQSATLQADLKAVQDQVTAIQKATAPAKPAKAT